jgi:hypothetical protein
LFLERATFNEDKLMESTAARLMPTPLEDPIQLAVQTLHQQLDLALRLLQAAAPEHKDRARRSKMIDIARDAYQYSVEALGKLPTAPPETLKRTFELMRQFRLRLAEVDFDRAPSDSQHGNQRQP